MNAQARKQEAERWKQAYHEHWIRLMAAIPEVQDRNIPKLSCDEQKTLESIKDMVGRLKENMTVMMMIASFTFVQGKIDSYRDTKMEHAANANVEMVLKNIDRMEADNRYLGNRILTMTPTFSTFDNAYARKPEKKKIDFKIPKCVLNKYNLEELNLPWDNHLLRIFLRPRIYILLQVDRTSDLCRLEIELFTEAAPQVVFDFIKLCKEKKMEKMKVMRGFRNLWLDCEIIMDSTDMSNSKIDFDEDALALEKQSGILSFSGKYVEGFAHGHLNFSISFRPLYIQKGYRIAFGRLTSGLRALSKLEEFATVKGGLKKIIHVADCGIIVDKGPYTEKCKSIAKLKYLRE